MKSLYQVSAALILCTFSLPSTGSGLNSGSSFTTGPSANKFSLYSATRNPAMISAVLDEDKRLRMNYAPGFALSVELGEVDNFADDLDELIDIIDDSSSTDESPSELLDRFNRVLLEMGESGYVRTSVAARLPVLPLYFRKNDIGDFSIDLSINADVALRVLDDELTFDDQSTSFVTNTSIYLKSGIEKKLSVGYSRPVWGEYDQLVAGVRVNAINLELSKQVTMLQDLDGREVGDVIEDEYDRNLVSTTALGMDFGLVWLEENYAVGLSLENANSPTFDYGPVGINCESRPEDSAERNSCEVTRFFVAQGRLRDRETHTKNALLRADGTYFLTERWTIDGSLDLAAYDDAVGFENQWLHLATAYESRRFWTPSWRLGYRENLAGEQLASMSAGLTLFGGLTLDIEYGLASITVEDTSVPRRVGFAIGFEETF